MKRMSAAQRTRHIANAKRSLKETRRRKITLRKNRNELFFSKKRIRDQIKGLQALHDAGFTDEQIAELFSGNKRQAVEDKVRDDYNSTYVTPEDSEGVSDAEFTEEPIEEK
tara:strand:+ start:4348 stop:4680 length:333 start_codon:yes stop_codon:yes gene_type:complete